MRQFRNTSIRQSWKKREFDLEPLVAPGTQTKVYHENLLILADNLKAMKYLLLNGFKEKIDLVYIDPPFYSGARYYHRASKRTDLAFKDTWSNQVNLYMNMIYPRLSLISSLLSREGSIFVHLDWHASHYVKIAMDEIFGIENFRNEIIVKRGRKKNLLYQFEKVDRMHTANDIILWYSKYPSTKFCKPLVPADLKSKWMSFWSNTNRPTMRYSIFGSAPQRGQWKWSKERANKAIQNYELYAKKYEMNYPLEEYWEKQGRILEFIRKRSTVKYPEYWIPPKTRKIIDNLWLDIESYNYSTGFSTEKHNALLERIIGLFSKPNSIISDLFCGSGTALVAAEKMGRRWIGCDSSEVALSVVKERLGKSRYDFVAL
jgi:adenine-specific DNA-methyltransferase